MKQRYGLIAAAALLLTGATAIPVQAQMSINDLDANPACGAFARWGAGGWTATAPSTMAINDGQVLAFRPGQSMGAGSTVAGVPVPVILDRHCGNM
jgi:hypothetical protein